MTQSIILIGPPGSGKSATARVLAARLKLSAIDSDALIVANSGMSIDRIFASFGEEHFRELETDVVSNLVRSKAAGAEDFVLSCGGGLPVREQNYRMLESLGIVVSLNADVPTLARRVREGETRPLLQSSTDGMEERIASLLAQRASTYGRPRYKIDTTNLSPTEVCEQIIDLVGLT